MDERRHRTEKYKLPLLLHLKMSTTAVMYLFIMCFAHRNHTILMISFPKLEKI
jgi:hypothetical protein